MGKGKNHTDELFSSRLRHFEASPPKEAWEGISSTLKADRRRQQVVVFWRVAASVAVLTAIGTTFFLVNPPHDSTMAEGDIDVTEQRESTGTGTVTDSETIQGVTTEVLPEETVDTPPGERTGPVTKPAFATLIASTGAVEDQQVPGAFFQRQAAPDPVSGKRAAPFELTDPGEGLLAAHRYRVTPVPPPYDELDIFQDPEEEKSGRGTWSLGTQVTPLYSYRSLNGSGDAAATYFNQVEEGLLAYAGGVNIQYSPRRRLSVQSGVYYSKMGVIVGNAQYAQVAGGYSMLSMTDNLLAVSNSSGTIEAGGETGGGIFAVFTERSQGEVGTVVTDFSSVESLPASPGEVIQHFEYLELPVILRYRVLDRKLGFNVLGGMSTNFLVGRDAYFRLDGKKEFLGVTGNIKPVNYSSILGVGLDYAVSERLNFNIEPTFRYYLNSINESADLGSHPYSFGFYTGLRYSF